MNFTINDSNKIKSNNDNKKLKNFRRNTLIKEWIGSNSINIS